MITESQQKHQILNFFEDTPNFGIDDFPLYLFNNGDNFQAYQTLGCHRHLSGGVPGLCFAVWAPNARSVSLVGDHNGWDAKLCQMKLIGKTGVWATFVPRMEEGVRYKYAIVPPSGETFLKSDPFGFQNELRPHTASVTCCLEGYSWGDGAYLKHRKLKKPLIEPLLIYEVHIGSWRRKKNGDVYTYRELAKELISYVCEMGYTHIELMPITEYPFDGSWGYQVTGFFSITARYGTPHDFMYFVDMCHKSGIGVIMDWVPAHFPKDGHGLANFDGNKLFENPDPHMGVHKEWGTLAFNYKRMEVVSFLTSSACFFIDKYHIDGIRVDAVTSMIYRSYGRGNDWQPNEHGGVENLEAVAFLQKLNSTIAQHYPSVLMIAEESTPWKGVTSSVCKGGLGFTFKWNMGWMNDTLKYISLDPYFRQHHHNLLTFLMMYAFDENFILPLSHDEVVHGKKSLVDKISGKYDEKFATLRALYGFMMGLPGKKLMFMGNEFAQFIEWRFAEQLDWLLLEYDAHLYMQKYVRALNKLYLEQPPLWKIDDGWDGFKWICENDAGSNAVSFLRKSKRNSFSDSVYIVSNFSANWHHNYRMHVPYAGPYEAILNSASVDFGGVDDRSIVATAKRHRTTLGIEHYIEFDVAPLCTVFFRRATSAGNHYY